MNNILNLCEFFETHDLPNVEQSLGKRRINMPQIKTNDFLADLNKHPDFNYAHGAVDTKSLSPTQSQFNANKIKNIVLGLRSGNEPKPIIISNDGYIVDGHHRWAAHDNIGTPVPVIRVNAGINDILDFLQDKPYVMTKGLHEKYNQIMEMTDIDNMRRQLVDLLRLRVQKSETIAPDDETYSKILSNETEKLINMDDDGIRNEYNIEMIQNQILPIK